MEIKIAIATDDGKNLTTEHFGSAKKYLIYSLDTNKRKIKFLEEIKNLTPEEKIHGDPEKAKAISNILNNVQVLVNLAFGPNIIRIRKRFVPIVSKIKEINKVLDKLKQTCNEIEASLNQQGDKNIIYI